MRPLTPKALCRVRCCGSGDGRSRISGVGCSESARACARAVDRMICGRSVGTHAYADVATCQQQGSGQQQGAHHALRPPHVTDDVQCRALPRTCGCFLKRDTVENDACGTKILLTRRVTCDCESECVLTCTRQLCTVVQVLYTTASRLSSLIACRLSSCVQVGIPTRVYGLRYKRLVAHVEE